MGRAVLPSLRRPWSNGASPLRPPPVPVLAERGAWLSDLSVWLSDRSERGGAWHGAPDPTIYGALMLGACLQVAGLLAFSTLSVTPEAVLSGVAGPGLVGAFVALTVVPVVEELLLRGALFAMFRARFATRGAALATIAASVALYAAFGAMLGVAALGAVGAVPVTSGAGASALVMVGATAAAALWLRLAHRALGPAIALNVGASFVALCPRVLG